MFVLIAVPSCRSLAAPNSRHVKTLVEGSGWKKDRHDPSITFVVQVCFEVQQILALEDFADPAG